MKLYNLTDVATEGLAQFQLVNKTICIGGVLIAPGEFAEIAPKEKTRRDAAVYVKLGAVAIDVLPPDYAAKKAPPAPSMDLESQPVETPKKGKKGT